MQSVQTAAQHFAQVPKAEIQRSRFDRSHGYKTTFDAGYLIPIYVDEALPGDTFNLNLTAFARLATPLKPVMDNMFMESFFFAIPNRLIMDRWPHFNGEQDNPDDSTDYLIPQCPLPNGAEPGSLFDYMGIPTGIPGLEPNSLHFRAYNLTWNQWFRDQNLQDSVIDYRFEGPDNYENFNLLKRGKRHDYFTSCLPWPQKGEAVTVPIGATAPVLGIGNHETNPALPQDKEVNLSDGTTENFATGWDTSANDSTFIQENPNFPDHPNIYADLTQATAVTINALREAFQIQKLYERDARGGTRYTEIIKSHFGVTSPDARLQRPEYLGGGKTTVNLTAVPQTSDQLSGTGAETPQGNLAAFGTASVSNHGFTKSFTEHCVLLGLISVRADLTYQKGLNRMWSRQTRWDYYWPALSHLGEQEVLNKEIYAQATEVDEDVFGYQERYAEYRYKPSEITGLFRSEHPQSLDIWHLSQDFENLPVLAPEFIEENPPIDRIIAVQDEPHFLFDSFISLKCARPMPTYGVPGMIDHF